jgi:hypothetical protein
MDREAPADHGGGLVFGGGGILIPGSRRRARFADMKRLLAIAALALILAGCDYAVYGEISVGFGAGSIQYRSTGWYAETTSTSLTVTAVVQEHGDARVVAGEWKLVEAPPGISPVLSNPFSPTTLITFPASGVYQFEYHVTWTHDGGTYHSVAPVQIVVYPSAAG